LGTIDTENKVDRQAVGRLHLGWLAMVTSVTPGRIRVRRFAR